MEADDDNPWDWVWERLTDQSETSNDLGAPVLAASGAGNGQSRLTTDVSNGAQNANLAHQFALGGQPTSYPANKESQPNVSPSGVADAFGTAGNMVAGQNAATAGLLATVGKDAIPAIRGVDHVLGSTGIGLGLDIAANAARASSEIHAGKEPNQAVAEAAGRVIAGNGIGMGTGLIIDGLLTAMFPPFGAAAAAAGVAGGALASYGAEKTGAIDAAGRDLAPLFKW